MGVIRAYAIASGRPAKSVMYAITNAMNCRSGFANGCVPNAVAITIAT